MTATEKELLWPARYAVVPILAIAALCHEANALYCQELGDWSQPPWDEAPDWQRESAIAGVRFLLEDTRRGPADSHESWLEEKRRTGWKWGPVKDPEKKEHPCMVPYHELPEEQRRKEAIFRGIVHAMSYEAPGAPTGTFPRGALDG